MTVRLEYSSGSSSKFYELERHETAGGANVLIRRWGRIGTAGQNKTQSYTTAAGASAAAVDLLMEKLDKGYQLMSHRHTREAIDVLVKSGTNAAGTSHDPNTYVPGRKLPMPPVKPDPSRGLPPDARNTEPLKTDEEKRAAARQAMWRAKLHGRPKRSLEQLEAGGYERMGLSAPQRPEGADLRYSIGGVARALYGLTKQKHQGIRRRETQIEKMYTGLGKLQREIFGRLYNPNAKQVEEPALELTEEIAEHIHKQLDGLPGWDLLGRKCKQKAAMAAVGTADIVDGVVMDLLDEWQEKAKENGTTVEDEAAEWCDVQDSDGGEQAALRAKLSGDVDRANKDADQMAMAIAAGFGLEPGSLQMGEVACEETLNAAGNLETNEHLMDVLDMLGHFMRAFKEIEASRYEDGGHTPYSVSPGDDLRTLLPTERLSLANPDTSFRTLYRLSQRQTLTYAVRSKVPKQLGPFHIALDMSGSMGLGTHNFNGKAMTRMKMAAAFALASLHMAADEGREVALTCFNSGVRPVQVAMDTPAQRWATARSLCSIRPNGGTNIDRVIEHVTDELKPDADMLLITDGDGKVSTHVIAGLLKKAELHYLHIGDEGVGSPRQELLKGLATTYNNSSNITEERIGAQAVDAAKGRRADK